MDLHARLSRIATEGRRAYITCKENVFAGLEVDSNVIVLPCISMIPPVMWTLLLAENVRLSIACDLRYCDDCSRVGDIGGMLFPRAIELAEERTGKEVKFSSIIPEKKTLVQKYTDEETATDRRAVFTGAATDVLEIASGKRSLQNSEVLADFYARRERQRAVQRLNLSEESAFDNLTPEGMQKKTMFPQQQMLLEAIERQHDIAPTIAVLLSGTDEAACTGSGECVASCPTGARQMEDGQPIVDPLYCVGCGICSDTCPTHAAFLEETTAEVYLDAIEKKA